MSSKIYNVLFLSVRSRNALANANIQSLEDLTKQWPFILKIKNLGRTLAIEIWLEAMRVGIDLRPPCVVHIADIKAIYQNTLARHRGTQFDGLLALCRPKLLEQNIAHALAMFFREYHGKQFRAEEFVKAMKIPLWRFKQMLGNESFMDLVRQCAKQAAIGRTRTMAMESTLNNCAYFKATSE